MSNIINVARGFEKADLVIKNANIVNVLSEEIHKADIAIKDGIIAGIGENYSGEKEIDIQGAYVTPSFIDGHVHLESTMMLPSEFAKVALPAGTTTVIIDPHEISNVLGLHGISFMHEAVKNLPLDVYTMLPSCVPATPFETSGFDLNSYDLSLLIDKPWVLGLAEMMNFPGVLNQDNNVMAKLELANLETSFANTQQNIDEKQEFIKVTEPEITSIEKTLDKIEEEHIDISEKMTDVQTSITEVEKLMNDADLKDLKEKTAGVEAEIKRYEKNMADANNEIEGLHQRIDFINTTIKTHNDTIERSLGVNKDLELDKAKFAEEIKGLNEQLEVLEIQIKEITDKLGELLKQRDDINKDLVDIETQRNLKASDIEKIAEQIESFKARRRELEPQLEETRSVLTEAGVNINELTPVEMSIEEITSRIQRLQKRMDDLGAVNMKALEDFENVSARQQELHSQIETLSHEREQILERMRGYEDLKKETFLKTYNVINENFKDIFHRLSDGEGTLILENEEKPFEGGLDIEAQPRDKKKQRLAGMSGGEKALTALSFVFAIQKYMPAPFYAFDEVDASLDGINVEKLAHIVQSQAETTQFIVVSHRKPMIESANRTIGVTQKEKGISKVTGVKLRD